MNILTFIRGALGIIVFAASVDAHAQQAFNERYVAARPNQGELVALPTLGIVPVGSAPEVTVPLDSDVALQLKEAIQNLLDANQESHFEVIRRASDTKVSWAFVVRNAPRAAHDTFTAELTEQLISCLHSLEDDMDLAALNVLLAGAPLNDDGERDAASAAGAQMLVHWQADLCTTRRNSLASIDNNRTKLTAATRGMLTDVFDPLVFRGQGLLDLIAALYPVYFAKGGFWTAKMMPRLHALFDAGVNAGLLTVAETNGVSTPELQTFWDWAILGVSTKPNLVRSFVTTTATGCVMSVPELSNPFRLARCVAGGKVAMVALRVAGQDYVAVRQVQP